MASNQVVLWSSWGTNDEGNHTVESVKAALLAMRWKQPEQLASGMRTVSINSRTLVQLGSHRMPWGTGDGRPVQLPGQAATPVDLTKPPSTRRRCQFAIEEDDAKSLNFWQCVNGAIVEIAHDNSTQW